MNIICQHCDRKIRIPDEKVPRGKAFSIPCPNCKNKISVKPESEKGPPAKKTPAARQAPRKETPPPKAPPPQAGDNGGEADNGTAPENPFEFLEEGAKTAVLCEPDPDRRARIRAVVEKLAYHILESPSPRDTLKQMRYHDFDLVVLNELFGTRDPDMNHVLKYLSQLPMINRRKMFVALLSDRFRTGDSMQAFNKSVNVIINTGDMDRFEKVLEHSIKDNDTFYRVFREALAQIKGQ